ncbi:PREDICTED: zinc finger protein 280A-like [Miniopterus natalensis]|uniref:zinc finger protein 280A-like n=1 Tax=Miniopterus natalensis TaxID=291302 RepID=UPI0007A7092E|nr:PREDICTED: zinc finger protein 280A-like [Miniopterus natalensis]XP_016078052.1 PREDICTED: zinc finger protein 280A-like [Miniopterus natalensis]
MGESKHRGKGDANTELTFVGVDNVSKQDEILFVRAISKPKPVISNILNRVTSDSYPKRKKGRLSQDPACTLHPADHVTPTSKAEAISPVSQSGRRATDSPSMFKPSSKPNYKSSSLQVVPGSSSDLLSPRSHCLLGHILSAAGKDEGLRDSKRLSILDINSRNSQRPKLSDGIPEGHSSAVAPSGISSTTNTNTTSEGVPFPLSPDQNGEPFSWAHANDKAHFNLMDPDEASSLERLEKTDFSSLATQNKTVDAKKGKLIILLHDFYYGQHQGDGQPEQKTHTAFKCLRCLKVLKNVKFMSHMKHHLELEKQRGDSWEIHTTCQHCHRQFLTPFQMQHHIESVHTAQEPSAVCKICELSFETDQVLLQHMKDNHKPGEMPYVCQVCSYRSSAFADVETHFRTCHENTKNLLCPFCLKIFKAAATYMNHFWGHWKKRVFWCSKCRLQFLTLKEKTKHQTKNHQTFKKPEQLEGLSPETGDIIQILVQSGSQEVQHPLR